MILLTWNCRGLAQVESKRSLKAIVNKGSRPRPFKSEEIWTREEASKLVVENAWRLNFPGSPMFRLCKKIK
nr:hypothetical protein CFP56_69932 [Quercus suber]